MKNTIEELLALVREVDEEDLLVKITEAVWEDRALQLQADISVIGISTLGTWILRCENVLAYNLDSNASLSLELTEDHPLLWEFKSESASAFFYGSQAKSYVLIGALYEAHENAVGDWLKFGAHLNNPHCLSKLLNMGSGLLASGPLPLLKVYQEALLPYDVKVDIRCEYGPKIWDGTRLRFLNGDDIRALLFGSAYVIGIGWAAERKIK